jgi:HK97 family phage portal protein
MKWPALFRRNRVEAHEKSTWLPAASFMTDPGWFQKALDLSKSVDVTSSTAVYACVNVLSQEVASLAIDHWRRDAGTGARERVKNSAVVRVLNYPNEYQTRSDFWLYMMRSLLLSGAAYAGASRNNRTEVRALHPLPPSGCHPLVSSTGGDVFYQTSDFGDGLIDLTTTLPARNVLNPRINCTRHPLIGETPITAFASSVVAGAALQRSVARFFTNAARPSGVLTTPKTLTKPQIEELRDVWNRVTAGDNAGGTPVLHSELKWEQITMNATDAETIASYQLTVADVAMAYRIPLFMLGDMSKATFRNVESLMRVFYTSSLRFYLEHLENALNRLFELDGVSEYVEFDIEAGLLRGDFEQRMNGLTKGVQGGIFSPNEAREREELPPKSGGDEIYLQRQMVPVSVIEGMLRAEIARGQAPPPAPAEPAPDDDEAGDGDAADSDEPPEDDEPKSAALVELELRREAGIL